MIRIDWRSFVVTDGEATQNGSAPNSSKARASPLTARSNARPFFSPKSATGARALQRDVRIAQAVAKGDRKASVPTQRLTVRKGCDYSDHMTTTLREAKAKLSQLVKAASRGEEVVITVHGKETAKLVGMPNNQRRIDRERWLKRLERLRARNWTGRYGKTAQEIQDEDRAERF
ncbi:MAG TPA: type II toxin-antitoxin system Phd/YefM family antitoxin [Chthoniobacterales bacterium]|nr:type II toxin-antitoxin system Phd/YefM family antitoxin [Chthoniobacterales bacterium]